MKFEKLEKDLLPGAFLLKAYGVFDEFSVYKFFQVSTFLINAVDSIYLYYDKFKSCKNNVRNSKTCCINSSLYETLLWVKV